LLVVFLRTYLFTINLTSICSPPYYLQVIIIHSTWDYVLLLLLFSFQSRSTRCFFRIDQIDSFFIIYSCLAQQAQRFSSSRSRTRVESNYTNSPTTIINNSKKKKEEKEEIMATDRERWFKFFNLFDADKSGDISQDDITLGMKVCIILFHLLYSSSS
jgi:hypothetical protein